MKSVLHVAILGTALFGIGCAKKAVQSGPPPAPEVSVLTVDTENAEITTELLGRINPVREAEVRARVTGILLKRHFVEGSNVKEGDLLFEIDPAPLEAALDSAKASYAKTEAVLKESEAKVERYKELTKIKAVSQQVFDEAQATLGQMQADLLANKAAIEMANLNLGYARVTAPISGRIGKALVTEGALVSATEATKLAVIRQLDPVYLDITQSSTEVLRLRRKFQTGDMSQLAPDQARIRVVLEDGTTYRHAGKLLFSDVAVDPGTGMITLRAEVPNPENILFPGMFARAIVVQGIMTNAVTIPQRTITRGPAGGATVLVVGADKKVELRKIQVDRDLGQKVIVADGLKPGEEIIVEGSQKAPPGTVVRTVPFKPMALAKNTEEPQLH